MGVTRAEGTRLERERNYWNDLYSPLGENSPKYEWSRKVEEHSYVAQSFTSQLAGLKNVRILSIGGGVDTLAIRLAEAGNDIVSVDLSPVATLRTRGLAEAAGLSHRVLALEGCCEELTFDAEFDVVVSRRALHCMVIDRVVRRVAAALVDGGTLFLEEPACFSQTLRWLHRRVPFHPDAPCSHDETELTERDLDLIREYFVDLRIRYFGLLARDSVAHLLCRTSMERLLGVLGHLDDNLINGRFNVGRSFSTYVIVEARK